MYRPVLAGLQEELVELRRRKPSETESLADIRKHIEECELHIKEVQTEFDDVEVGRLLIFPELWMMPDEYDELKQGDIGYIHGSLQVEEVIDEHRISFVTSKGVYIVDGVNADDLNEDKDLYWAGKYLLHEVIGTESYKGKTCIVLRLVETSRTFEKDVHRYWKNHYPPSEDGAAKPPAGWLDMSGTSNNVVGGGLSPRIGKTVDAITVDGQVPPPHQ